MSELLDLGIFLFYYWPPRLEQSPLQSLLAVNCVNISKRNKDIKLNGKFAVLFAHLTGALHFVSK